MFTIDIMILIVNNKYDIKSCCEYAKNVPRFKPHLSIDKNRTNFK